MKGAIQNCEHKRLIDAATGKWRALLITVVFTGAQGFRASRFALGGRRPQRRRAARQTVSRSIQHDRSPQIGIERADHSYRADGREHVAGMAAGLPHGRPGSSLSDREGTDRASLQRATRSSSRDNEGRPKYALHAYRHFYASWCINRRADGGLELPLKVVQERLGHACVTLKADVYGHLYFRAQMTQANWRRQSGLCWFESMGATQMQHAAKLPNRSNAGRLTVKPTIVRR